MKKRLALLSVLFSVCLCVAPVRGENIINQTNNEITDEKNVSSNAGIAKQISDILSNNINITLKTKEELRQEKIEEAQEKINNLDKTDKMQWFIDYKQIQDEYAVWIDKDETIYDYFTEDELQLLFSVVEAEVTGTEHFQSKINVASVIFNRLYSEDFGDNLIDILTQKSQFSSYHDGRYMRVEVTETTILACEYAFQIGDSTNGALYFDSCDGNSWASGAREYIFTDSVNHSFYR